MQYLWTLQRRVACWTTCTKWPWMRKLLCCQFAASAYTLTLLVAASFLQLCYLLSLLTDLVLSLRMRTFARLLSFSRLYRSVFPSSLAFALLLVLRCFTIMQIWVVQWCLHGVVQCVCIYIYTHILVVGIEGI